MPERSDRQGVKSKDHHHTCPEAEDHHCPECCSCECCSRHSRSYETHRRYSHNRPIYPWEPDYISPKDQYRMGGESEAEQWQRLRIRNNENDHSGAGMSLKYLKCYRTFSSMIDLWFSDVPMPPGIRKTLWELHSDHYSILAILIGDLPISKE